MSLRTILFLLAVAGTTTTRAQFTYAFDQSIPVDYGGTSIPMAWSGGLNSPQFSTMDVNGDQHDDLVIFDRTANKVITLIAENNTYRYAPEYEGLFPQGITQWLLLRDFNCDGKKDIFTSDPFGIRVFVNITPSGGSLAWKPFNNGNPLFTIGLGGTSVNLQMNGTDIPGLADIDGDGDLDILDARFSGVGSIEWNQNVSIDSSGNCDSLQFVKSTQNTGKWGNFEECDCGSYLFGSGTCPIGGRITHAAGKSILTLDMDGDGDHDLLFSEETCSNLYLLPNVGTPQNALITSSTEFPSSANPVSLQLFPAAYYEDVDFDGVRDLVVAVNLHDRDEFDINFKRSVSLYKNTGTTSLPEFTYVRNNFLQDGMIDIGDNAAPAFQDADGDGDLDLFIGNYLGINTPATIYYFENTGTLSAPSFKFITDDYNDLAILGLYNIKPQFADMDGDGKIDLVFTATELKNGVTSLQFIPNLASDRLTLTGQPMINTNMVVNLPENILVIDVNSDGKNDLLIGKTTGAIEYWMNIGPKGTFSYSLSSGSFLGVGSSIDRQSLSFAAADLDADGREELITGDQNGILSIYGDFRAQNPAILPVQNIIFDPLKQDYTSHNLGAHVWPAVANLYNSDKPTIISGNELGGIHVLKNEEGRDLPPEPVVDIYPNPTPRGSEFTIKTDRNALVQFVSVLGQKMSEQLYVAAHQPFMVNPEGLSPGLYIARFSVSGKTYNRRFVVY